jgi:mono/diheme cytochrome c family protein
MVPRFHICRWTVLLTGLLTGAASLAAATAEEIFREQIQPVLVRDCQGCHGKRQSLANLDLSDREGALKGGGRGPALLPGKPSESLLIQVLEGRNNLQMPPGGPEKKLPAATVAAFRKWVAAGAVWPGSEPAAATWNLTEQDLWAFRPVRRLDPAKSIDTFLNAPLRAKQIAPAPKADRRTLIRRVTIDLTGLPPTPEDVEAFVSDEAPKAWGRLIERLLASPRYGERWGRHWLDVVRYADTNGFSNDFERPNAWRYRDYVIRSFNQDKPYDRFLLEQVAGDEIDPENPEAVIATGFLRAGPWEHTMMSVEAVTRQLFLDDVTHATANVFLGLTLGCARCHDHKFDPIPTKDYYRVQSVFATTEFARPATPFLASENTASLPEGRASMKTRHDEAIARIGEYREKAAVKLMARYGVTRVEDLPKGEMERAMNTGEGLDPDEYEEFKLFLKHWELFRESLVRYEPRAFAVSSGPLDGATDGGGALKYAKRAEYKPAPVRVLPGGNIQAPAEAVTPGVLSAIETYSGLRAPPIPESIGGRRTAWARWMADPANPLTARVMVNRIWQYHFGRGLAQDTSNFGKMGHKPVHPELIDHLAASLIQNGWSVKSVHRLILGSEAYQRASRHPEASSVAAKDPGNALLSYFPPRRAEAEVLRDSILAVSGELNLEAGGPGVFPQINEDVARQPQHRMGSVAPAYSPSPKRAQRNRRTVYTFQQRSLVDPFVEVFNGPSLDLACDRRENSTVPTQAFGLLNSQFVNDMALAMAVRLEREAGTLAARIRRAFHLAYGRAPEPRELAASEKHFENMLALHRGRKIPPRQPHPPIVHKITSELTGQVFAFEQQRDPSPYEHNLHPSEVTPETRALADLALVFLNSSEFVYIY